jgi:hypothetical protein
MNCNNYNNITQYYYYYYYGNCTEVTSSLIFLKNTTWSIKLKYIILFFYLTNQDNAIEIEDELLSVVFC